MGEIQEAIKMVTKSKMCQPFMGEQARQNHETILEALQDQAEREKGCEYCKINGELAEDVQADTIIVAFTKHDQQNKRLCRPLNFCPMCGRNLRKP